MTSLVIQVLTREDAENLKSEPLKYMNPEIVIGKYTGTYGLRIPFETWYYSESFARDNYRVNEILEDKDLKYYEFWDDDYYEGVDFRELFPNSLGVYSLDRDDIVKISYTGRIYYRGCPCENSVEFLKGLVEHHRDPLLVSGLSKIYRRGFLIRLDMRLWKKELGSILKF